MKTIYFLLGCSITFNVNAQQWSAAQLAKANTTNEVKELTFEEKQTIMYLNLARMYPKDYKRIRFNKNALFGIIIALGIVSKAKFTSMFNKVCQIKNFNNKFDIQNARNTRQYKV